MKYLYYLILFDRFHLLSYQTLPQEQPHSLPFKLETFVEFRFYMCANKSSNPIFCRLSFQKFHRVSQNRAQWSRMFWSGLCILVSTCISCLFPRIAFLESGLILKVACMCVCAVCAHGCIRIYKRKHAYLIYYACCMLYDVCKMSGIRPLWQARLFCIPLGPFMNPTWKLSLALLPKAMPSPSRTMLPSF